MSERPNGTADAAVNAIARPVLAWVAGLAMIALVGGVGWTVSTVHGLGVQMARIEERVSQTQIDVAALKTDAANARLASRLREGP